LTPIPCGALFGGDIMSLELPELIENYVRTSNAGEADAFMACFAGDATVVDEGKTLTGKSEIREWFLETKGRYNHRLEPLAIEESADEITLAAKVSGDFEGSPVTLRYHIGITAGLIRDLRIS
jgi:hypothetical protein